MFERLADCRFASSLLPRAGEGARRACPVLDTGADEGALAPCADIPGFCKSATLEEIRTQGHVLTPGRYVGAEDAEEDDEPFVEKMQRLTQQLREQQAEARRLDDEIVANLAGIVHGG